MADQPPIPPTDGGASSSAREVFKKRLVLSSDSTPSTHRPDTAERNEASLPPHLRDSINNVPVTPGFERGTYKSGSSEDEGRGGSKSPQSYFQSQNRDVVASPDPLDENVAAQSPSEAAKGALSGADILRRMSLSAMIKRRESLSDIRAGAPALALSGNIISATFNIPHSLKYKKGADWVSELPNHLLIDMAS